ncbi:MAG: hypothetical protein AB1730_09240 [Myxococcota bacterium]
MFRSHWLAAATALLVLAVTACKGDYGGVRLNVTLIGDEETKCLKGWITTAQSQTISSNNVPRNGDRYVFGIFGSEEIQGEITVGVNLFRSPDCTGGQYASQTADEPVTVKRNAVTRINLTFDFSQRPDGGLDDAGVDGGCDPAMCTSPPVCQGLPGTCGATGCQYVQLPEGTDCGDGGVCNAVGQCGENVCPFRPNGSSCNDGLPCTTGEVCSNFQCVPGMCQPPPVTGCYARSNPPVCGDDGGCVWTPSNPNGPCSTDGGATNGRCETTGLCSPWFNAPPSNLPDDVRLLPAPTTPWTATPGSDGGPCVIDTSGATPGPRDVAANCGFTGQALVLAQDAGSELAVFRATDLLVPTGVEVQFVGDRPAVLAIFGDATVHGTLSAASATGGEVGAGAQSASCPDAGVVQPRQGGTGGSYRTQGGTPGTGGVLQALNGTDTAIPLRGGCAGREGGPDGGLVGIGGAGGPPGGALQLTVMGQLTIGDGGVVSASGAGGRGGAGRDTGGGGGGSGGTILLEARSILLMNCALTVNGGAGGQGGRDTVKGEDGADGSRDTNTPARGGNLGTSAGGRGGDGAVNSAAGGSGQNGSGGEGGGGAGAGVGLIRVNGACTRVNAIVSGELKGTPCN